MDVSIPKCEEHLSYYMEMDEDSYCPDHWNRKKVIKKKRLMIGLKGIKA